MNEVSKSRAERARFAALQVAGIALTGAVVLAASAALAWSLRHWQENPGPPPGSTASPASPAPADGRAVVLGAGRLAYQVHCARCHGAGGHGDGSDAERLTPPPRDFASDHWRFAPTADAVRQAIVAGIPGTAMPGWGSSLSGRELDGLIAHVLSLAPEARASRTEAGEPLEPLSASLVALLGRAGFTAEATPRPAPPLVLCDLNGKETALADHRGRMVLILFWGTTCSPCLTEMPQVFRFAERHRGPGRGLEVLAVCVDATDASVVRDVAGPQLTDRPLYIDPTGKAGLYYDVQALPSFALIDHSGRLIARAAGARDWTNPVLDDVIDACLARSTQADLPRQTSRDEDEHAPRGDRRPG